MKKSKQEVTGYPPTLTGEAMFRVQILENENAHLRQIIRDVRSLRSIDGGSRASHLLRVAIEDICKQPIEGGRK